ncbi:MAG TPA: sn-glycerol-3-phosphate ABC transporter permease UgpA [Bdellovibrionota bacterium]|jgi:sn-glycerol 3-phosphate transport system permease protein|nr:sn-glycerol-3-phosphate ABC transporter permease UgpA [Bdellovibrionota bacterium]
MQKKARFESKILPYALIVPQLTIIFLFFLWPAFEAIYASFHLSDAFGLEVKFAGLENFTSLITDRGYLETFGRTAIFSTITATLSMTVGLILATVANRALAFKKITRTLLIWPYAIAPAMAGILWMFLFHPSYGVIGFFVNHVLQLGWNPVLNGKHAMALVIIASSWKNISYNFIFFLAGLQSIPKSVLEAASIDGASPAKRFFSIVLPLISPTFFFLIVMNLVYTFFESFGVIHMTTQGGPGSATTILVYKVYADGFIGQDLGSSSAQSVIMMLLTIVITFVQFRFVEKRVHYSGAGS